MRTAADTGVSHIQFMAASGAAAPCFADMLRSRHGAAISASIVDSVVQGGCVDLPRNSDGSVCVDAYVAWQQSVGEMMLADMDAAD